MHQHCRAEIILLVILILTGHLSVCGAAEKGGPATADEALADSSAALSLSVISAALSSCSGFFPFIL